jgi:hypothetical protein
MNDPGGGEHPIPLHQWIKRGHSSIRVIDYPESIQPVNMPEFTQKRGNND